MISFFDLEKTNNVSVQKLMSAFRNIWRIGAFRRLFAVLPRKQGTKAEVRQVTEIVNACR